MQIDEMESIESSMKRWTWNEVEKCWELMKNGQIDGAEAQGEEFSLNRNVHSDCGTTSTQTLESFETLFLQQQQSSKEEITLRSNEESSLQASSQHLVRECRIDDAEEKVDDEMESIENSMKRWTWNEVEKCWELKKNGQIDDDGGNDEVGEECDDEESEVEDMDEDDPHIGNDEELPVNGQVSDDKNSVNGVDQLNGHEHGSNIDCTEAKGGQLVKNVSSGEVAVTGQDSQTTENYSDLSRVHDQMEGDMCDISKKDCFQPADSFVEQIAQGTHTPCTEVTSHKRQNNQSKRPLNAFMLWSLIEGRKITQQHMNIAEISVLQLRKRWSILTDQERQPFIDRAKYLRLLHLKQYPDYQYGPSKNSILARYNQTTGNDSNLSSVVHAQIDNVSKNDKVGEKNDNGQEAAIKSMNEDVEFIGEIERPAKRMRNEEMEEEKKDMMDTEDHVEGNDVNHGPQGIGLKGKFFDDDDGLPHQSKLDCAVAQGDKLSQTVHYGKITIRPGFKAPTDKQICPNSSKFNDLTRHILKSTEERPNMSTSPEYVCQYCSKVFNNRTDLTRHIEIHERPFTCTWENCTQTFTRDNFLSLHIRRWHRGETYRELLNDQNIEHTNQTVLTNSIESVPSPSHRHNTIPVFVRKSYPNEHQVTQLNKTSNQSSLDCLHNKFLPQNQHQTLQHQQINLDQFNANPDQFNLNSSQSTSSNQTKPNPLPNQPVSTYQPTNLSLILSTPTFQSNLETKDEEVNESAVLKNVVVGEKNYYGDDDEVEGINEDVVLIEVVEKPVKRTRSVEMEGEFGNVMDNEDHVEGNERYQGQQEIDLDLTQNILYGQVAIPDKSPTSKHVCEHCGKEFKYPSDLTIHIRTHTGERPYKCPKCAQTFNSKFNMMRHHTTHNKLKNHVCPHCDRKFPSSSRLENHIRMHTGHKLFVCTWENCRNAFSRKIHLNGHMCSHTGEKPYKCPWKDCTKVFTYDGNWYSHFKGHFDNKIPFECPWKNCHEKFAQLKHFRFHAEYHTGNRPVNAMRSEEVEGECDEGRLMKNHVQGDELYFEDAQPLGNEENLLLVTGQIHSNGESHSAQNTEKNKVYIYRPYNCPKCFQTFTQKVHMQQHLKSQHDKTGKHVCPHCDRAFPSPSTLENHIRIHTGHKLFVCTWENCRNAYIQIQHFMDHMCSHTGEKAHKCPWKDCTKDFTYRNNLQTHFKRHNFDLNCQIDDDDEDIVEVVNAIEHQENQFPIQNMLNIHQHVISNNKCSRTVQLRPFPNAWAGCTKTFTDEGDHLQKHLELIHNHPSGLTVQTLNPVSYALKQCDKKYP